MSFLISWTCTSYYIATFILHLWKNYNPPEIASTAQFYEEILFSPRYYSHSVEPALSLAEALKLVKYAPNYENNQQDALYRLIYYS